MRFEQKAHLPTLAGPPSAYKTYEVLRPRNTHFRKATCQEVDCPNWQRGWRTVCDVSTELGRRQANYIRMHSGRHFDAFGQVLVTFTFPPGQECFSQHTRPLDREPHFRIASGDWRQRDSGVIVRAQDWIDDFGDNQLQVKARVERGA